MQDMQARMKDMTEMAVLCIESPYNGTGRVVGLIIVILTPLNESKIAVHYYYTVIIKINKGENICLVLTLIQ